MQTIRSIPIGQDPTPVVTQWRVEGWTVAPISATATHLRYLLTR
ncbi:hypothetical protein [Isoptericola sp. NPDC056605]